MRVADRFVFVFFFFLSSVKRKIINYLAIFTFYFFFLFFNRYFFSPLADGTCAGVRCHPDATCEQNSPLGPVCICKTGYQGDGRKCSGTVHNIPLFFFDMKKTLLDVLFVLSVYFI